jgi:hypothetical protein
MVKPKCQEAEGARLFFVEDVAEGNIDNEEDQLAGWQKTIANVGVGLFCLLLIKLKVILVCVLVYALIVYLVG